MKKNLVLAGFILAKFILQYLLISPEYDLQRDEYLHLDQGSHLAWGYISVPPVSSWIAYLIQLLGNGFFWVKFFPALFGALTILVVWKTIEALKGDLFALSLGALAILVSAILRINILFQPNSLDIFFWTLVYYTVVQFIRTDKPSWLYAAGVAIGFGILSKYNMIFLLLGLLPAIMLTEHRKIFLNKHFYFSVGIAVLIVLPNFLWQLQNNFPTFHQLQELNTRQLVNVKRADFIKEQFLFFISSLFILIAALVGFFSYPPFKKYRLFFYSFVFSLSLFIYLKAKGYYAIGLYPILIAFGSVYLEVLLARGKRVYLRPVALLLVVGLSIRFIQIAFPFESPEKVQQNSERYKSLGLLRWEDGKEHNMPQDFADMLGWRELAMTVDSAYGKVDEQSQTLVLCDNYGQAGAINYYSRFKNIRAVSMNADYINWVPLDKPIRHVILVQEADDDDPGRQKELPLFESIKLVGENNNPLSRENGTKVYLLSGAKADINKIIEGDIKESRY